eukprot:TRINITY_DN1774_c0_g1_i2.p1 TRINITY_DN1774_c0_g1~~TRINITY_DN1774_c0_g1_i2.p1  ORF type:complete len:517 (+),score=102.19 TRINITY_DN1774_c0_g1_i2:203-1552(+)
MESYIQEAAENKTQIIVFPEDGIYNFDYFTTRDEIKPYLEEIPVMDNYIPCKIGNYDTQLVLTTISCFAIEYNMTIVVDMGEIEYCSLNDDKFYVNTTTKCPEDKRFQYNTQVAFSSSGEVLSKYRKTHLFPVDLDVFNYPPNYQLSYFKTDFDVVFAQIICFDIFFQFPSVELSRLNITDFAFSTYWNNFGTSPLMISIQLQSSFSRATQSNLLGSNIGDGFISSGSGIYSKGNPLNYYINPVYKTLDSKLIIADVPIISRYSDIEDNIKRYEEENVMKNEDIKSNFSSPISFPEHATFYRFNATSNLSLTKTLTNKDLVCNFNLTTLSYENNDDNNLYSLVSYQGPYFGNLLSASLCSIIKCRDTSLDSCYLPTLFTNENIKFHSWNVTANFNKHSTTPYFIAGRNKGALLNSDQIYSSLSDNSVSMYNNNYDLDLLNIVLYSEYIP